MLGNRFRVTFVLAPHHIYDVFFAPRDILVVFRPNSGFRGGLNDIVRAILPEFLVILFMLLEVLGTMENRVATINVANCSSLDLARSRCCVQGFVLAKSGLVRVNIVTMLASEQ